LDIALSLDPTFAPAYLSKGLLLSAENNPQAVEALRRAAEDDATAANAHYALGNFIGVHGDPKGAIAEYMKVLEVTPDYVDARLNLAVAYFAVGQLDDCEQQLQYVLRIAPSSPRAHSHLGTLRARQGKNMEAAGEFRTALKLDPNDLEAAQGLAELEGR